MDAQTGSIALSLGIWASIGMSPARAARQIALPRRYLAQRCLERLARRYQAIEVSAPLAAWRNIALSDASLFAGSHRSASSGGGAPRSPVEVRPCRGW